MVEEKRDRAEEASESPQKTPRLDILAAAAVDPGCSPGSPTDSSEWPSSGEAEEATSTDSMDDSGRCYHIRFDMDMVVYDLKVLEEPRKCHYARCNKTWKGAGGCGEDDQGLMKCIDCPCFSCSGWPVDREKPQGHARWHAGKYQHWVAQWCNEPNTGYCFLCARVMRLSDWSAVRNQKDQQGLGDSVIANDGGSGAVSENPQKSPRIDLLLAAAAENPQKYPHLNLLLGPSPAPKAPLELSELPLMGEEEATSDWTTYDIGSCEHLFKGRDELDDMVLDVRTADKPPVCEHFPCAAASSAELMVCTECSSTFCTGEKGDNQNPLGHAQWHARMDQHWVAVWYDEPYKGYCFKCGHILKLGQDKLNDDEWAAVTRNKRDDQAMLASNGRHEVGTVAGYANDSWVMPASNWKDEWGLVASYETNLWAMVAGDDASEYANGNGCVIRGIPNLVNTCYMNALLQCLLALGELRTMILGSGARLGNIGLHLKQLFVETSSRDDARRLLDPQRLLKDMRVLYPQFNGTDMQDSAEFLVSLRSALEKETVQLNNLYSIHGGAKFPIIGDSIFGGMQCEITCCKRCPNKSEKDQGFNELHLALPSKEPSARSVALPPKIRKELFQQTDKSDGEKLQTTAEGSYSQFPGSEFGDEAMEKTPTPLKVGKSVCSSS